jgi:hypothetical protein
MTVLVTGGSSGIGAAMVSRGRNPVSVRKNIVEYAPLSFVRRFS